jgi:hypothetical protein
MGVIRSRYENHIEVLTVLFEDFPPILIPCRLFPAFLAKHAIPPGFVNLGEGDTLKACPMGLARMGSSLSTRGDESHLEFFVESLRPDEAWETNRACCPNGSGAFQKLTT